jgi:dipeptidyl aminopeptidase/acylaminoacyl peptidase
MGNGWIRSSRSRCSRNSPRSPAPQSIAAAAALTLFAAGAAAERSLDAVAFARPSEYEMVRISPDGAHLAVGLRREGRLAVVVLHRDTLDVTASVNFDAPNEVHDFFWVNAQRLVVSAARSLGPLDYPVPTGQMQAIDADGGRVRWLDAILRVSKPSVRGDPTTARDPPVRELHVVSGAVPGDKHIVVNRVRGWNAGEVESELVRIDVDDGRATRLLTGPRGSVRLLTDPDRTRFVAVVREPDLTLRLLRRDSGATRWQTWRTLAFRDGVAAPLTIDASGRVWFADSSARDTTALVTATEGGSAQPIFAHDRVDLDLVMIDPATGTPYAVRYVPDRPRYAVFDGALARHVERMMAAFPEAWLEPTSHTADRSLAVFKVRSDTMAARFYVSDGSATPKFLLDSRRWLSPSALSATTPLTLRARDGVTLHGYLTRPRGAPPHPLVALVHGGPHFVRDDGQFDETVQYLAATGYAVLQVNFRGSGGYGRAFLEAGFGHWGDLILDDIADAVAWAIDQGTAEAGRVCIMGASFGAYAAVASLARHPALYACAIGFAGPYDLRDVLRHGDMSAHRFGLEYLRTALGQDTAALDLASPIRQVRAIRAPVLLGHGVLDARVPIRHSRRLARALERAERAVEVVEFDGEAHGLGSTTNRERWFTGVGEFLKRHLPVRESGHRL